MFCPKCGADAQTAEAYCKRCGEWLPDLENLRRPKLFRALSREEKIRKMRILEAISAGLSLTSAAIILSILAGGGERQLLILAAFCSILVVVYQVINFYLGYKIQQKINHSRTDGIKEIETQAEKEVERLNPAETTQFVSNHSVIENTTELLEPIQQRIKPDKQVKS